VAVFDRSGGEVTAQFLEGRDEYPVGKKLFGLDMSEFEKCALIMQGDMDGVVPADEKLRRASTLKARLENAADTHIGDTNASEAMKVLEEALRKYNAHELDFTGTIDNAIDRLTAKRELVEVEIRELDATLIVAQAPLEDLHRLTQEERKLQATLRDLENERRAGLAVDVRRSLEEHEVAVGEVTRLEAEAGELSGTANLPPNAEGELREAIARHEEAMRGIDGLEARRREELAREREAIAAERLELTAYDSLSPEEADQCVGQAAELRHLLMQDALLRHQVFELRDGLASKGYEPEQVQFLQQRFASLTPDSLRLLRQQSELNLVFQTEAASLEQQRTSATETLRAVDAARAARRTPGWILFALGLAGLAGGGAALALGAPSTLGIALLAAGGAWPRLAERCWRWVRARARGSRGSAGAARRGPGPHQPAAPPARRERGRAGGAGAHDGLPRPRGPDAAMGRLRATGRGRRPAHASPGAARGRRPAPPAARGRGAAAAEGRGREARHPEVLERVAYDARRSLNARQRLTDLEKGFDWVEEEKRKLEAAANSMRERAERLLQAAGIPYEPGKGWAYHVNELKRRVECRVRYSMIVEELVPAARRRLHPEHEVTQRRRQLEMLLAGGDLPANARPSAEIEMEVKATRSKLEETQRRRADVRVEVEEVWRRHAQRKPDLSLMQERLGRAIERAKRFKQSVELARETIQRVAVDTHRKWADFLNERVAEILGSFGASVEGLRFGEDLDFSVQIQGGPLISRGKAHAQLSAGARDQLYLAVRLAISEYLSRGKAPLPLLLDDVFATSDDTRLRAGMHALVESFGAGHQLILTTCHRSRMNDLRRADPDLYRERVHWVDLRAGDQSGHTGSPKPHGNPRRA
jgi:hypothetical protein